MNKIARLLVGLNRPKSDSALYAWGFNTASYPLTNILGQGTTSSPVVIDSVNSWAQLATGDNFVVGIKADGSIWSWGDNTYGQLGRTDVETYTPKRFSEYTWSAVSVGDHFAAAIRSDGKLFTWGRNSSYGLGTGGSVNAHTSSPVQVGTSSWAQVSAGKSHVMALRPDGILFGWGDGQQGQTGTGYGLFTTPTQVQGSSFASVSAGYYHTVAVMTNGTLWGWGRNTEGQVGTSSTTPDTLGQPYQIGLLTDWSKVAAGGYHTVATRSSDSSLWGWGRNTEGQLGDNTNVSKSSPVQISSVAWSRIHADGNVTAAIRQSDSTLFMWGSNYPTIPYQYANTSWTSIATGNGINGAVKPDGTLWIWGDNTYGQVGDGTTIARSSPVQIASTGWANVVFGARHTVARKTNGSVWVWGDNTYGQLGDGTTVSKSLPVQVWGANTISNSGASKIQAGYYHTAVVLANTSMATWGRNDNGQLGVDDSSNRSSPVLVGGGFNWSEVRCGYDFTVALSTSNQLFGWGNAYDGQLGSVAPKTPSQWNSLSGYRIGEHGAVHGIMSDGTMWTWGRTANTTMSYMFGTGNMSNSIISTPQQIPESWAQVSSGDKHVVAIRNDGSLWGWGNNTFGQLGLGANPTIRSTPTSINSGSWSQVSAGALHNLAIKSDGTIWGWGSTSDGRLLDVNQAPASWTTISSGRAHTLALTADGRLYAWGNNATGQLGTGETTTVAVPRLVKLGSWIAVGTAKDTSYAIRSDYTLWAWGDNTHGQLGDNTTVSKSSPVQIGSNNWLQISAANNWVTARTTTGTIRAWGKMGELYTGTASLSSPVQLSANTNLGSPSASWSTVSAGPGTLHAIDSSGSIWGMGRNVPVYFEPHVWKSINTSLITYGKSTAISGIDTDGKLWTWGYNDGGVLGQGTTNLQPQYNLANNFWVSSPTQVGTNTWITVSIGSQKMAGIQADGTMWEWGNSVGGAVSSSAPVQVGVANTWIKVSAGGGGLNGYAANAEAFGGYHAHAIKADGTLWTWGYRGTWAFDGNNAPSSAATNTSPYQIGSANFSTITGSWAQVSTGAGYAVGIKTDGTMWVWGEDRLTGRLGVVDALTSNGNMGWKTAAYTGTHGLAIDSNNKLWAWGENTHGQIGTNHREARYLIPEQVGNSSWTQVAVGDRCSFAVRADGTLWVWGHNGNGDLGLNSTTHYSSPVQLGTANTWTAISAGGGSTGITRVAGIAGSNLYSWGTSYVGDNAMVARSSPVQIGSSMFTRVAVGPTHTLAATSLGTVVAWGDNTYGQLGDYTTTAKSSPIQLGAFSAPQEITSLSTAYSHSAAVVRPNSYTQGNLWAWGDNTQGQLGLNSRTRQLGPTQVYFGNSSTSPVQLVVCGPQFTAWVSHQYNNGWWAGVQEGNYRSSPVQLSYHYWLPQQCDTRMRMFLQKNAFTGTYSDALFNGGTSSEDNLWPTSSGFERYNPYWSGLFTARLGNVIHGRMVQIPGSWSFVHAGVKTTFAIAANNKLFAWGWNELGEFGNNGVSASSQNSPIQIGNNTWSYITTARQKNWAYATGYTGVFAVDTSNTAWTWGGAFGGGGRSSPVQVGSAGAWKANTGGIWTAGFPTVAGSMGVTTNNELYLQEQSYLYSSTHSANTIVTAWPYGQPSASPYTSGLYKVFGGSWAAVSAGRSHSVAIAANGTMWSWGNNTLGQLGWGNTATGTTPAQVGVSRSWINVDAGSDITLATLKSGSNNQLYGWGYERQGILGTGSGTSYASAPTQISTDNWSAISAYKNVTDNVDDSMVSYGIKNSQLFATGNGYFGDNASNTTFQVSNTFVYVTPMTLEVMDTPTQLMDGSWSMVSAGFNHSTAIRTDGKLFTWGRNGLGQIGDGTITSRSSPVQVGTSSWSMISAGANTTVGITSSGGLYAWGLNSSYELGDGTTTSRSSPVHIGTSSWSFVAAGNKITAAATIDGETYVMGATSEGTRQTPTLYSRSGNVFDRVYPAYNTNSGLGGNTTGIYAITSASSGNANTLMGTGYVNIPVNIDPRYIANSTYVTLDGEYPQEAYAPVLISSSTYYPIGLSAGYHHASAVSTQGGSLFMWGLNRDGQLGLGDRDNRSSPAQVGSAEWGSVSLAGNSSLSWNATDNHAYSWGYNSSSWNLALDGITTSVSSPVQISTNIWADIYLNEKGGLARTDPMITTKTDLFMWGDNSVGQAGDDTVTSPKTDFYKINSLNSKEVSSPVQVGTGGWKSISVGTSFAVGVKST